MVVCVVCVCVSDRFQITNDGMVKLEFSFQLLLDSSNNYKEGKCYTYMAIFKLLIDASSQHTKKKKNFEGVNYDC